MTEYEYCICCDADYGMTISNLRTDNIIGGGDLGTEYLEVPLCLKCRGRWFLDESFRKELIEKYKDYKLCLTF